VVANGAREPLLANTGESGAIVEVRVSSSVAKGFKQIST